ncbi:MAG: tetratricopeptide repeat protein [Leptospiraceae bacterium]|nr:tetratricopeptide repeat protein [Leptospiraceae bacterium]
MEQEKKPSEPVEYTEEELAQIRELTSFFNRAPGQVDLPPTEGEFIPQEEGEELPETPQEIIEEEPRPPRIDLGKFTPIEEEIPELGLGEAEPPPPPISEEALTPPLEVPSIEQPPAPPEPEIPSMAETLPEPVAFEPSEFSLGEEQAPPFAEGVSQELSLPAEDIFEKEPTLSVPELSLEVPSPPPSEDFSQPIPEYPEPPSLEELQPEVVLSQSQGPLTDLSQELSSLAQEAREIVTFSPTELRDLRRILKTYPSGIRAAFIEAVLEDKLTPQDTREIVDAILAEKEAREVAELLQAKSGIKVEEKEKPKKVRTVASRPAYTAAGMERQAKLLRLSRNLTIAALLIILIAFGGWFGILKPYLYRKLISQGRNLILYEKEKPESFTKAEELFEKALTYYPHDYYAYLQFADAYKKAGKYPQAFEKLFGKLELVENRQRQKLANREINSVEEIWGILEKVPFVEYANKNEEVISLNGLKLTLKKYGAFLISQLIRKKENAQVLLALGQFHSNPAKKFRQSPYHNNLLAIDYFKRLLTFKVETPLFEKEKYLTYAISGIGNVYYYQKDYYRALEYFEKITREDPYSVPGQTGVMQCLLKLYQTTQDPRLVIQQHSIIKHELKLEEKLPMFLLARLAAFYIDLPPSDDMRIRFNLSPTDSVTGEDLKDRAEALLITLFTTQEKDIYGNVKRGDTFAEGYYQRGRFYRYSRKQLRMAMKQMEYAYKYNPRHFLALNEHAEMLMEIKDYAAAMDLLKLAYEKISPAELELIGDELEDETLLEADLGIIPFNLGKAMYLALVQGLGQTERFQRMAEIDRYQGQDEYGRLAFLSQLDQIDVYFNEAKERGVFNKAKRAELLYYSGWSAYARGNYPKALAYWEEIPTDMQKRFPSIDLAKSHGLYRAALLDPQSRDTYLNMAMGHLLFLKEKYARLAESIKKPSRANTMHNRIFTYLSMIENNLGAIYEMKNLEKEALLHYYSSLNYSKRIEEENETAQLNIKLAFKRKGLEEKELYPVIMDFIPPFAEEDTALP